jgi:branched-chain amino acid aminotransferase
VTEGPGFNIFVVKNGRVATPASGVFDGMTRRTTLEICPELQIKCEERLVDIAEVRNSDEVFITSTAGGIMPITKIDGQVVGNGKMGPATQRIHDEYWGRKAKGWLGTKVVYRD